MADDLNLEPEDDEPTAPFWMTTFSDMVTLLLTFFVLIVAMSEVEVKKFKEALSYFQGHVGVLENTSAISSMTRHLNRDGVAAERAQLYETLLEYMKENSLQDKVEVRLTERGVHVVVTDSLMFRSGEAELIEPSRSMLRVVSTIARAHVEQVVVEGHTDDRPIATARYPSNWELSAARAASVVRFLLEQEGALDPSQYRATGFGEFRPVAPNDSPESRVKNRRVEILFRWEEEPSEEEPLPYLQPLPLPLPGPVPS